MLINHVLKLKNWSLFHQGFFKLLTAMIPFQSSSPKLGGEAFFCLQITHRSSEQNLGLFEVYIGDEMLPSFI